MRLCVCFLLAGLPSQDVEALLADPRLSIGVTYLDGDVMADKDLRRCAMDRATAVFIFANKFATNTDGEDSRTILRALSIKR